MRFRLDLVVVEIDIRLQRPWFLRSAELSPGDSRIDDESGCEETSAVPQQCGERLRNRGNSCTGFSLNEGERN